MELKYCTRFRDLLQHYKIFDWLTFYMRTLILTFAF